MILKILLGVAALVLLVVVIAAFRPARFTIARSTRIHAPAETVFSRVNTAKAWESWSPFGKADPGMTLTYEGPAAGVGAVTTFDGRKSGTGRSVITESREPELIRMKLEMIKPMRATNDVKFTFQTVGDVTAVTWSMSGENNLMMRVVGLFIDCDKMIGGEFDQGLAALKETVEASGVNPTSAARLQGGTTG